MNNQTIRLNKYLANQGIAARREIKTLVKKINITVNGERVSEPGVRVNPQTDDIRIDGKKLIPPKLVYYLLNKPKGIISTTADEYGRKNVLSLIPDNQRLYPVGRLDKDTTGLILLTNDGEMTNLLTHPRYHVSKVYRVTIRERATPEQLRALRNGVLLDDGITYPAQVRELKPNNQKHFLEITLHEGRNRQIRRMCETVGIKLLDLDRIKFGPIQKGNLKVGQHRPLNDEEITLLKNKYKVKSSNK